MLKTATQLCVFTVIGIALGSATPASAHISLQEPAARYDGSVGTNSKSCPCGVGRNNGNCSVENERSDDFRSPRVAVFEPGSTITLQWDEYVGHSGRYRVAFDPDGADMDDFNANILLDIEDPPGGDGNIGNGSIWEVEVTLPDTPCTSCTLQLIQVMDGNLAEPVTDPVGRSSYYQCADIVLGDPAVEDMGGPDPLDMGTSNANPGPPDMDDTPSPDSGITGDTGSSDPADSSDDDGGCAVSGATPAPSGFLLLLAALGFVARRRTA